MSTINGKPAKKWIKENHPKNGLFKVYWKDVNSPGNGGASFKDEGEGLRYEWYYKDGKRDGVSKGWYPSGQLKQTRIWKNSKPAGIWTEWYQNGQKHWEWSKKDGLETRWHSNGQKKEEETFKDGKWGGLRTQWYLNGQKEYEKTFKSGKEDGLYTYWYDNGQKWSEGTYKDGERDGLITVWYENGQKEKDGTLKDEKKEGKWTFWYENGQKEKEGTYKDGKKDGKWTYWYENGQKRKETTYKDGNIQRLASKWRNKNYRGITINNKNKLRAIEQQKYVNIYKENPEYGNYDHSKGIHGFIEEIKPKSIIDVGCGNGQFVDWCTSKNIKARGVDIASKYDITAPAHQLPFVDNEFEIITSFDMLEHLIEEEVEEVLAEFDRVSNRYFVLKITYDQSVSKGTKGELLHPTVRPMQWWNDSLSKFGRVSNITSLWRNTLYTIVNKL